MRCHSEGVEQHVHPWTLSAPGMGQSGPSAALSEEWSWWSEHIDDT